MPSYDTIRICRIGTSKVKIDALTRMMRGLLNDKEEGIVWYVAPDVARCGVNIYLNNCVPRKFIQEPLDAVAKRWDGKITIALSDSHSGASHRS